MDSSPNRITDPWGARTPYAPGDPWPVRTDLHLADGLTEADVERWVPSASILHSNGDAMDIAVRGGRIVGVRGRAADRVNRGRLGPKDLYGWQANHYPDRLTRPLVRENGRLVETDWDTAMDRVVSRTRALLDDRGPGSVGFYTSGQLFLEEYYTLSVLAHAGVRTNHLDGNTRLCTATAAEALKESFGSDGQPGSYEDIDHADTIALFGHNMAETQTVLWTRVLDRLEGSDPPRLLCVDPRYTPVARRADVHLAPRPGTNVALLNALLHEIIRTGRVDRAHLDARTVGYDGLAAGVERCTPPLGRGDLRCPGRRDRTRRRPPRRRGAAHLHGSPGCLPVAPGVRRRRAGQQPAPDPRHARPPRLRADADERPAHRPEHPRVRSRRRPPRLP
ncbi:Molybdopterin oxidoreductase [Streptomyces sp. di188]|nr:Molybdopterin oxidoreductase [Streptomyces sp. di50b]SCE30438.1 Molybdopterin oxidoreductase [Streptomyces sp. di188]